MSKLNIQKQEIPTVASAYADIIGQGQMVELSPDKLIIITDQPFKLREEKIQSIVESMRLVGQLEPAIVTPSKNNPGKFIVLSGRHRKFACELAGLNVKCIIRNDITDDEDTQRFILLSTNNDRNNDYLPSEKAFAFKEETEILKRKGRATNSEIAEKNGINTKEVQRYIRLTYLIKPLLDRVDNKTIPFIAAVDLSYLSNYQQSKVFEFLLNHTDVKLTTAIAKEIKMRPDDDLENIFYSKKQKEVYVPEEPSANENNEEVKVDNLSSSSNTDLQSNREVNEIDDELSAVIAYALLDDDLLQLMVAKMYSTDEVIEYFKINYAKSHYGGNQFIDNCPIEKYQKAGFLYDYGKKLKLIIGGIDYEVSYKDLDKYFRKYIRNYMSKKEIIRILNDTDIKE